MMRTSSLLLSSLLAACAPSEKAADSAPILLAAGTYTTLPLSVSQSWIVGGELEETDPWDGEGVFPEDFELTMDEQQMSWTWEPDNYLSGPLINAGTLTLAGEAGVYTGEDVGEVDYEGCPTEWHDLTLSVVPADESEALITLTGTMTLDMSCFAPESDISPETCDLAGTWRLWPPTPDPLTL